MRLARGWVWGKVPVGRAKGGDRVVETVVAVVAGVDIRAVVDGLASALELVAERTSFAASSDRSESTITKSNELDCCPKLGRNPDSESKIASVSIPESRSGAEVTSVESARES